MSAPWGLRPFAVALLLAIGSAVPTVAADDTISVTIDHATLMRVPDRTSTIVIGNPLIADVSLQTGGVLVVTGKGYGATNFLALDRAGNVLTDRKLLVKGPTDNIVQVYYGMDRATLSCEPKCQPRIMLGDSPNFFNPTLQQTATRNGSAAAGSSGGASAPAAR